MRSVMSVAALVLQLAPALAVAAAGPSYRAQMTGEQLVRDMLSAPDGGLNSMRRERAMGYLDGVMDAAAGRHWCPAGRSVPHELNYVVTEEMQRLSPARLKSAAGDLALEVLGRHYPCRAAGTKS